jgi:hypothetical protein
VELSHLNKKIKKIKLSIYERGREGGRGVRTPWTPSLDPPLERNKGLYQKTNFSK